MVYKLTYFDLAFRGEPARLIFAAAGEKFVDNRIQFQDWPSLKSTLQWGQLPVLQIGDHDQSKSLSQSKSIYRYLGRTFKLAGADEWESAKCDELVDAMSDIVDDFAKFAFKERDPAKKQELRKTFYDTTFPAILGKLNKVKTTNGGGGGAWLVGQNLTWADITIAEFLRQIVHASADPSLLAPYPQLKELTEGVFNSPNIKQYVESSSK